MAEINQALVQYFETVAGLKGKQETTNAAHGQTQLGSVTVTEEELTSLRATALERLPERATKAQVQKRRNARDRLLTLLYQRAAAGVRAELEEEHRRFVLEKGHTGTKAASKEHSENLKQAGQQLDCQYSGCGARPVPYSQFCISHILHDPYQVLYVDGGNGVPVLRLAAESIDDHAPHNKLPQEQEKNSIGENIPTLHQQDYSETNAAACSEELPLGRHEVQGADEGANDVDAVATKDQPTSLSLDANAKGQALKRKREHDDTDQL